MDRIFGTHDEGTIQQLRTCLDHGAEHAVLCADGHLGYAVPIGGVLAHPDGVFIQGIGFDIGCGVTAFRTDADAADVRSRIGAIMDTVWGRLEFGVGRRNETKVDSGLFDDDRWKIPAISGLKQLARDQLGTIGSGNHYVDILVDENDAVWVAVHFGSRGFGHKTATHFMKEAGAVDGMHTPPTLLKTDTALGDDYLECASLAQAYAHVGRYWVAGAVVGFLGANTLDVVSNHHNAVWRETHFGRDYWVVRKGATPAWPGQRGFVGGSMGDDAYIVEGVESPESASTLYSTVHGAGRVMSRAQAKKTVDRGDVLKWLSGREVELRGAGLDEAPQAYRRLADVIRCHAGSIKVVHTLRPIGVAMAGDDTFDPYKD